MPSPDPGWQPRRSPHLLARLWTSSLASEEGSLIRLLACGDFHLGAGVEYGPRPGDRLADQQDVLDRIVDVALSENVDTLLFAGDAFERRSPSPAELIVWRRFVGKLGAAGIPMIGIAGNHDVASAELPTGMEVVDEFAGRTPKVAEIGTLDSPVMVAMLPWTPPARLIANRNGGDRDELHAEVADLLIDTARELRSQIPAGRPSILLAHWSVSGAVTPTGADVGLFREPVLPLEDLLGLGFDYVVLGHIHETQVLAGKVAVMRSENGTEAIGSGSVAFYVGSPMVLNFGEAKGHHGVMLIDTDTRSLRHIEISDRRFVTIDVDLTYGGDEVKGHDATDDLAAHIAEHLPLTDAVVRIRYKATAEQARRVDHAALRGLCADAGVSKLYSIAPEIVRTERARVEGVDESIEPMQALDLYIAEHFAEISRGPELRDLTARYLGEVAA